jgi:hypothetical protein
MMEMGLTSAVLLAINGGICFIFGLWVFLKNIEKNLYFTFFIFSWSVTLWAMIRFAFYTSSDTNIFLYREIYSTGGLALLAGGAMLLYYLKDKPNKYLVGFYYLSGIFLVTVPFWDHITITNLTLDNGILNYQVGFPYYLYFTLTFIPLLYVSVLMIIDIFKNRSRTNTTLLLLAGFLIFQGSEFIYGFILPALKIAPAIPVDSVASIIFIILAAIGIMKYGKKPAAAAVR